MQQEFQQSLVKELLKSIEQVSIYAQRKQNQVLVPQKENALKEYELFEMDTRVRQLVFSLMEPHLKDFLEQKSRHEVMSQKMEKYMENYDEFKQMYFQSGKGVSVLQEIQQSISQINQSNTDFRTQTQCSLNDMRRRMETLQFLKDQHHQDKIETLQRLDRIDTQIECQRQQSLELKQLFIQNVEEVKNQSKTFYVQLQKQVNELSSKFDNSESLLRENKIKIQYNADRFTILQEHLLTNQSSISKLQTQVEQMKKDLSQIDSLLEKDGRVQQQVELMRAKVVYFENYLEKYLPLFLQGCISDTLHNCLSDNDKVQLVAYEEGRYTELHKAILDDSGEPNLERKISEFGQLIERSQKRQMLITRQRKLQQELQKQRPQLEEMESSHNDSRDSELSDRLRGEFEQLLQLRIEEVKDKILNEMKEIEKNQDNSDDQIHNIYGQLIKELKQLQLDKKEQEQQLEELNQQLLNTKTQQNHFVMCVSEISDIQLQQQNGFKKLLEYSILQSQFHLQEIQLNGKTYDQTQALELASKILQSLKFDNKQIIANDSADQRNLRIRTSQSMIKRKQQSASSSHKTNKKLYLLGTQIQSELSHSFNNNNDGVSRKTNVKLLYQSRRQ